MAMLWTAPSLAQSSKRKSLLAPSGATPGTVAAPRVKRWAEICTHQRRRPMALVVALDKHRDYRPAHKGEAERVKQVLYWLCPGDTVSVVEISQEIRPLGERMVVKDLADLDDLLLRVEERREPREFRRLNHQVIAAGAAEWGRSEIVAKPETLRALVYFTRDLESRAPRNAYVDDFNWARPPYWLAGHALIALFKPITSDEAVVAWETFLVATPSWASPDTMDQGLRVDLKTWLEPVRLKPKPKPKPKPVPVALPAQALSIDEQRTLVIPEGTLPDPSKLWSDRGEQALLWHPEWTPWLVAGILGVLLLMSLTWTLLARGRRGGGGAGTGEPSQLTLIVRDRIHDTVVSQERVRLLSPVRVGASMTSDVVVPGPYAAEILPSAAGGTPRVRSTNSLGLEIQRSGASRALRATESVPVQLRSGDRINLGGGHLLEIRIA